MDGEQVKAQHRAAKSRGETLATMAIGGLYFCCPVDADERAEFARFFNRFVNRRLRRHRDESVVAAGPQE